MDPLAFATDSTYGVVIHRNFRPLYVDEKYAHIYGFQSAEQIMQLDSLFEIIDSDFHIAAQQAYDDVMSGVAVPGVRSYVNQDIQGRLFTVLTVEHIVDFQGEPAMQITVIDMSSLDKANALVRENERKYRELIANSYQGIIVHRDFKPLMVNQAFVDMTRAPSIESLLACPDILPLIPESRRLQVKEKYKKLISGDIKGFSSEVENQCFDGSNRIFQLYENGIDWDGEPAVQCVMVDITDKYRLQQKLAFRAKHDDLTGVLKRNALYDYYERLVKPLESCACVMLDIDNFKQVNDKHGHLVGDQVIVHVASLCQSAMEGIGAVARWGGEEFLILLPNISKERANLIASSLVQQLEQYRFQTEVNEMSVTMSAGLIYFTHCDLELDKQVSLADINLYKAKAEGKNRLVSSSFTAHYSDSSSKTTL